MTCRLVLDEDLPADLAAQLRSRGLQAESVNEMRSRVWPGLASVSDDEVSKEVARSPSVLITLNFRDYADKAFIETIVQTYGISVAMVRIPKAESKKLKRPQAIRDIVHRHAHRICRFCEGEAVLASATRRGMRIRKLAEIVGGATP